MWEQQFWREHVEPPHMGGFDGRVRLVEINFSSTLSLAPPIASRASTAARDRPGVQNHDKTR